MNDECIALHGRWYNTHEVLIKRYVTGKGAKNNFIIKKIFHIFYYKEDILAAHTYILFTTCTLHPAPGDAAFKEW